MATLTNDDFTFYKHVLYTDPGAKDEMNNAALSKADWKATMQAIEDRWVGDALGYKAAMDAAAKATLSNPLSKKLSQAWMDREAAR